MGARTLRKRKDSAVINIAGLYLITVPTKELSFQSRAKQYHNTPVFTDNNHYIEFNPTWTIPPGNIRNEVLPKLKADLGHFGVKGYDLIDSNGTIINPATVSWQCINARGLPFCIAQPPGPKNALGLVELTFPNKHSVYLHDRPGRKLFSKTGCAFSHGCIRVKDPMKFAEVVLRH